MSLFYGVATGSDNVSYRVPIESNQRGRAEQEAKEFCKKNGWQLDGVYPVKGTQKQGVILTKNMMNERKLKGKKGYKPPKIMWG